MRTSFSNCDQSRGPHFDCSEQDEQTEPSPDPPAAQPSRKITKAITEGVLAAASASSAPSAKLAVASTSSPETRPLATLALKYFEQGRRPTVTTVRGFFSKYSLLESLHEDRTVMREVFNSCVGGQVVLVKTWKKQQLDNHQSKEKCFKEVMLAESCCHTNITELLDVFNGDVPRLVYSWPANSMLLHHAVALGRTRSFAHSQKAAVMADVLKGLAFLHSRGVVHQGLAPVAVGLLFSAQKAPRQAQILDLAGSAVIGCVNEAASGLPEYRAPEIHLGTTDLHPSQDIWAIGAIMALLATGVELFETGLSYREDMLSITRMLGNPSDLDCASMISLRHWSADFAVAIAPMPWKARMDEGCGPGAASLMEQMLFFACSRSFRKHKEKQP
jgi:serine/threonine protein kinase